MQCNRDHADDKEYGHYTDTDSNGITNANDSNDANHIIILISIIVCILGMLITFTRPPGNTVPHTPTYLQHNHICLEH